VEASTKRIDNVVGAHDLEEYDRRVKEFKMSSKMRLHRHSEQCSPLAQTIRRTGKDPPLLANGRAVFGGARGG